MPFPIEQHGEFSWQNLRALDVDEFRLRFLAQAAEELHGVKATDVEVQEERVIFRGGVFRRVVNWNLLIWIDRGYIQALPTSEGLSIQYVLSFRQLFIVSFCAVAAILVAILLSSNSLTMVQLLTLLVGSWLLLFGLNWIIAVVRFPLFIERILQKTRI